MKLTRVLVALSALALLACTTAAMADDLTDPEDLWVNSGCGNTCPLLFNNGGKMEVTSIPANSLYLYLNGHTGATPLVNPVILLIGIPNDAGTNTAPGISSLSTGSGQLGGTNIYLGSGALGWNISTGYSGSFTSGVAYDFVGFSPGGSNSQSFTNWHNGELAINGINATSFGIYIYTLTDLHLTGGSAPGVEVNFLSDLPIGTFAIAYGCSAQNTAGTKCSNVGNTWSTPFTQSGIVTPEPGSLALLGAGILGLFGVRRIRR